MPAILELRAVSHTYDIAGQRIHALRPVDLTLGEGEYLAVTGASGSGKSTLLQLMGLLMRPSAGRVLVRGRDTHAMTDVAISALRGAAVGFVFQSFHLLPRMTILENVELPLLYGRVPRSSRRATAMRSLARVGLESRAYSLPSELSGGQRQRVAVARAVVRRPLALLCDEPTGNLDSAASGRVAEVMRALNQDGVAIVVATHNPEVAAEAQRRLTIEDGDASELPSGCHARS